MEPINADHDPVLTVPLSLWSICFVLFSRMKEETDMGFLLNSALYSKWIAASVGDDKGYKWVHISCLYSGITMEKQRPLNWHFLCLNSFLRSFITAANATKKISKTYIRRNSRWYKIFPYLREISVKLKHISWNRSSPSAQHMLLHVWSWSKSDCKYTTLSLNRTFVRLTVRLSSFPFVTRMSFSSELPETQPRTKQ
jgi:hypothetical protein